jgi:mono/diheme cytochrome c family protein
MVSMNATLMPRIVVLSSAVAFASGTLAGFQGQEGAWVVPEEARAVPSPIENTPEALAAGGVLFKKHCVMCHGETAKGDGPATKFMKPAPPDISTGEAKARMTDGEIFYKITTGKRPMPQMDKKLSETERWQVVLYVRSLQVN